MNKREDGSDGSAESVHGSDWFERVAEVVSEEVSVSAGGVWSGVFAAVD